MFKAKPLYYGQTEFIYLNIELKIICVEKFIIRPK